MKGVAGRIACTAPVCVALSVMMACGSKLQGRYGSDEALFELEFMSGSKANFEYVSMPRVEVDYEVSGKTVKIKTSQFGTIIGTIGDDGCLAFGGEYGTICREESGAPDLETKRKALSFMKSSLRNLVTAQEAYFMDHDGHYANSIAALGDHFEGLPGVTIIMANASAHGFQATATYQAFARKCVIAVGEGARPDGEPVCQ